MDLLIELLSEEIPARMQARAREDLKRLITGGLVDGPLAMDNAVDPSAARTKGLKGGVAGLANILVVPGIDAGNMLAKQLVYLGDADSATAREYGPQLFKAQALTWREAAAAEDDPERAKEIFAAKQERWNEVADQVKESDPEAYENLRGTRSETRVGYALLSAVATCLSLPFLLLAALLCGGAHAAKNKSVGEPGEFDYYALALSWSPSYCATNGGRDPNQCGSGRRLGFVLHGLWPQYEKGYPQSCSREPLPDAKFHVWFRATGRLPDDPVLHQCVLAYASDMTLLDSSLMAHGRAWGSGDVIGASLDHAMWFHRPFRADDWLLYDQWSPSASGSRGLAAGRMWTRSGSLAVSVVQEGLIRRIE